ncbi:MAG: LemA family protein, partial [Clostridium perfringens]
MEKLQKNKLNLIILGIVLAFVLLISMIFVSNYNSVVRLEEEINESSGNIEVSQKRRMDLIPNYVDSVQDYKKFEKETLEEITKARSQA